MDSKYLKWQEKILSQEELDSKNAPTTIEDLYNQGFVFTRIGKGVMQQTRSLRIKLANWQPSSENRRIIKRTQDIISKLVTAKIPDETSKDYDWKIHSVGSKFYENKFGKGVFSANKIKALLTDKNAGSFNSLLIYMRDQDKVGYCISYMSDNILHYSYPFYDLNLTDVSDSAKDLGLGMMIRAIQHAKDLGLTYVYIGSFQRPGDIYKLQFKDLEWFDGKTWQEDTNLLKTLTLN